MTARARAARPGPDPPAVMVSVRVSDRSARVSVLSDRWLPEIITARETSRPRIYTDSTVPVTGPPGPGGQVPMPRPRPETRTRQRRPWPPGPGGHIQACQWFCSPESLAESDNLKARSESFKLRFGSSRFRRCTSIVKAPRRKVRLPGRIAGPGDAPAAERASAASERGAPSRTGPPGQES